MKLCQKSQFSLIWTKNHIFFPNFSWKISWTRIFLFWYLTIFALKKRGALQLETIRYNTKKSKHSNPKIHSHWPTHTPSTTYRCSPNHLLTSANHHPLPHVNTPNHSNIPTHPPTHSFSHALTHIQTLTQPPTPKCKPSLPPSNIPAHPLTLTPHTSRKHAHPLTPSVWEVSSNNKHTYPCSRTHRPIHSSISSLFHTLRLPKKREGICH